MRLVLHTTEGWNIEGALSIYRNQGVWPHFTVDVRPGGRFIQHIDTDFSAMALYNGTDPMQTNRAGVTLQVEICGFAAETHTYDDAWYQRLATEVVAPICKAHGIPARCTKFYGAGDGVIASESWPGRYWSDKLYPYAGILGHQTIGDGNDHWDPGRLDAERLLNFAFGGGTIIDPVTGMQRVVTGGAAPGSPLLPLEDDGPMDFVRERGTAEVYLRSGMFITWMQSADHVARTAADLKIPNFVTEIDPLTKKGLIELKPGLGDVPAMVRSLGVGAVEVVADANDRWKCYGLVNGKPARGGAVVSMLWGNVIEAATATRMNAGGQTLEQRTAAEVAMALKPILDGMTGGGGVDPRQLADEVVARLLAWVSERLGTSATSMEATDTATEEVIRALAG